MYVMYVSYHEIYSNLIPWEKPIRQVHLLFASQEMSLCPQEWVASLTGLWIIFQPHKFRGNEVSVCLTMWHPQANKPIMWGWFFTNLWWFLIFYSWVAKITLWQTNSLLLKITHWSYWHFMFWWKRWWFSKAIYRLC